MNRNIWNYYLAYENELDGHCPDGTPPYSIAKFFDKGQQYLEEGREFNPNYVSYFQLIRAFLGDENAEQALQWNAPVDPEGLKNALLETPVQLDDAQFEAVCNAWRMPVSIIEGPPGNGKTETILNLVSTVLAAGMTVAVVSGNNEAIANIEEKVGEYRELEGENVRRLCRSYAPLGNTLVRKEYLKQEGIGENVRERLRKILETKQSGEADKLTKDELEEVYGSAFASDENPMPFLAERPFITSTAHSLGSLFKNSGNYVYDFVIIDECSQMRTSLGLKVMAQARHLVLAGDSKQLPPVITMSPEKEEELSERYGGIGNEYRIRPGRSFMDACRAVFRTENGSIESFLSCHYRCHLNIIRFCDRYVYENRINYKDKGPVRALRNSEMPFRVLWYPGEYGNQNAKGESPCNLRQIEIFLQEEWPRLADRVEAALDRGETPPSVGVAVPFRGQVRELIQRLKKDPRYNDLSERMRRAAGRNAGPESVYRKLQKQYGKEGLSPEDKDYEEEEAGVFSLFTVHKIQGRSFDMIYYLPVRDSMAVSSFAQNKKLVNVAVSRAREEVCLIVSAGLMDPETRRRLNAEEKRKPAGRRTAEDGLLTSLLRYIREAYQDRPKMRGENGFGFIHAEWPSVFDNAPEFDTGGAVSSYEAAFGEMLTKLPVVEENGLRVFSETRFRDLEYSDGTAVSFSEEENRKELIEKGWVHLDFAVTTESGEILLCAEVDGEDHYRGESRDPNGDGDTPDKNDRDKDAGMKALGMRAVYCHSPEDAKEAYHPGAPAAFIRLPAGAGNCRDEDIIVSEILKKVLEYRKSGQPVQKPLFYHAETVSEMILRWMKEEAFPGAENFTEQTVYRQAEGLLKQEKNTSFRHPTDEGRNIGIALKYLRTRSGRQYIVPVFGRDAAETVKKELKSSSEQ